MKYSKLIEFLKYTVYPNRDRIKKSAYKSFYKKTVALICSGVILISAVCSSGYFAFMAIPTANASVIPQNLKEQSMITNVKPTKQVEDYIQTDTAFKITTAKVMSETELTEHLDISPKTQYEIKKTSGNTFTIAFPYKLKENTLYKIKSVNNEKTVFSWAFQTNVSFGIINVSPFETCTDNYASITVDFTHSNVENFSEAFSIYPAISGTFEKYSNRWKFIPAFEFESDIVYTVTIDKSISGGNNETLDEDYVFSFATTSNTDSKFIKVLNNQNTGIDTFSESEIPSVTISYQNTNIDNPNITTYKLKTNEDFETLKKQHVGAYGISKAIENDLALGVKLYSFSPVVSQNDTTATFSFTQPLEKGCYINKIETSEAVLYQLISIISDDEMTENTTENPISDSQKVDAKVSVFTSDDIYAPGDIVKVFGFTNSIVKNESLILKSSFSDDFYNINVDKKGAFKAEIILPESLQSSKQYISVYHNGQEIARADFEVSKLKSSYNLDIFTDKFSYFANETVTFTVHSKTAEGATAPGLSVTTPDGSIITTDENGNANYSLGARYVNTEGDAFPYYNTEWFSVIDADSTVYSYPCSYYVFPGKIFLSGQIKKTGKSDVLVVNAANLRDSVIQGNFSPDVISSESDFIISAANTTVKAEVFSISEQGESSLGVYDVTVNNGRGSLILSDIVQSDYYIKIFESDEQKDINFSYVYPSKENVAVSQNDLNISITVDKDDYLPKSIVTATVSIRDGADKPVSCKFFANVLDYKKLLDKSANKPSYQPSVFIGDFETDKNGKATFSFELPDVICDRAISITAFNADSVYKAHKKISVSKDFYISAQLKNEYDVSESILPVIRFNYSGLSQDIEYSAAIYKDGSKLSEYIGTAATNTDIPIDFGALEPSQYKLRIAGRGSSVVEAKDYSFSVAQTAIASETVDVINLDSGANINMSDYISNVKIAFLDEKYDLYANVAKKLLTLQTDRADNRLSLKTAEMFLHRNSFIENDYDYINIIDMFSLEALHQKALTAALASDFADKQTVINYFYDQLYSSADVLDNICCYLVLAAYGEPVYKELKNIESSYSLSGEQAIYLGLAYSYAGDHTKAYDIFEKTVVPGLKTANGVAYYETGKSTQDTIYLTSVALHLASKISAPQSRDIVKFLISDEQFTTADYTSLAAFIEYCSPEYNAENTVYAAYDDGKNKEIKYKGNEVPEIILFNGINKSVYLENSNGFSIAVISGKKLLDPIE